MKYTFKAPLRTLLRLVLYTVVLFVFLYVFSIMQVSNYSFIALAVLVIYIVAFKKLTSVSIDTAAKTLTVNYRGILQLATYSYTINYVKADWTSVDEKSFTLKEEGKKTITLTREAIGAHNLEEIATVLIKSVEEGYEAIPAICPVCGNTEVSGLLQNRVSFITKGAECQRCYFYNEDMVKENQDDFLMWSRQNLLDGAQTYMSEGYFKDADELIEGFKNLKQLDVTLWPAEILNKNPNWTSEFDEEEVRGYFKIEEL